MSTASQGRAREHRVRDHMTAAERFWPKVQCGDVDTCWVWTAALNKAGYGKFFVRKEQGRVILTGAHRWAYEALRADIPPGLPLDHLCRNRACVNPWHLEPVTHQVNTQRGVRKTGQTHCKRGHSLSGDNLGHQNGGYRFCRTCKRMTDSRRYAA